MRLKKALRHYEAWTTDEARDFINYYLTNITGNRDERTVLDVYAKKVNRTFDAIKFRQKEVLGILTNGEQGLMHKSHTPQFIEVINDKLASGTISKGKMSILFE